MNKPQTLFALVITACIVIPAVYTFCDLGKASAGATNNLTDAQHRATTNLTENSSTVGMFKNQDKQAIEQRYSKSASVKEHQTLAFRLGGWEHWLTKYLAGEFSIEHLTQQEKDHLFNLAAGQVSPAVMQQFIQSGFRVTPKTNYAVINGGSDLVAHQALVMEKLTIIRQHTGLEGSSMPYLNGLATTGVFDRVVAFGYLDVMKYLDSQGVKAEQADEVFTSLIKGRQPNVDNFKYLIQLGYTPGPQLLAIAKERQLDQRNPELFKLIEQYQ